MLWCWCWEKETTARKTTSLWWKYLPCHLVLQNDPQKLGFGPRKRGERETLPPSGIRFCPQKNISQLLNFGEQNPPILGTKNWWFDVGLLIDRLGSGTETCQKGFGWEWQHILEIQLWESDELSFRSLWGSKSCWNTTSDRCKHPVVLLNHES